MQFISRLARWRKNDEAYRFASLFIRWSSVRLLWDEERVAMDGVRIDRRRPCFFCVSRRVYKYCCCCAPRKTFVACSKTLPFACRRPRLRNYKYFVFLLIFMRVPFLKFTWENVVEKKHEKSTLRCRWYANGKRKTRKEWQVVVEKNVFSGIEKR